MQSVNSSFCPIPPPSGRLPAVKVNGPQIRPRFFLKWRQISKHSSFSTSNENDPIRTEEYTCTMEAKEEKDLDLRGFSSHNLLFTQMTLTDLGSAQNA